MSTAAGSRPAVISACRAFSFACSSVSPVTMLRYFGPGMVLALFACCAFAADDVASAVVATVKTVDKGTKTVVVKTGEGTEHTFRFIGRTVAHGAEATAKGSKDAFEGMKVTGLPLSVLSRGEFVIRDKQFVGTIGSGRYLKRKKY